jgi:uncharacterized protein (DUF433 family)
MTTLLQNLLEARTGSDAIERVYVAGTRIRVQDIAAEHEFEGLTPERIAREFPQLSLAQVHAALAYFFDHRDQILAEMNSDSAFAETLRLNFAKPSSVTSDPVRDSASSR